MSLFSMELSFEDFLSEEPSKHLKTKKPDFFRTYSAPHKQNKKTKKVKDDGNFLQKLPGLLFSSKEHSPEEDLIDAVQKKQFKKIKTLTKKPLHINYKRENEGAALEKVVFSLVFVCEWCYIKDQDPKKNKAYRKWGSVLRILLEREWAEKITIPAYLEKRIQNSAYCDKFEMKTILDILQQKRLSYSQL